MTLRLPLFDLSHAGLADRPFEGAISKVDAAPIQVSLVTATGHTVLRLASHVASSTDDLCFVNLQLEGLGRTTQRGHEQISYAR